VKPLSWPRLVWWMFLGVLVLVFSTAVVYKDDPVVRLSVRQFFVGLASITSDVKDLKDVIKKDIKEELKK